MKCHALALVAALTLAGAAWAQVAKLDPGRAAEMHDNFTAATRVQTAVVRGDLEAARAAARALVAAPAPAGLPDAATKHSREMTAAASRAANATNITNAAVATTTMLATCGACHRSVGTMPALATPERPVVGGTVGHMLDHQRAVDRMQAGLVIPSNNEWLQGARALRAAALHARELPRDAALTPALLRVEEAVHRLAEEAVGAETTEGRIRVFSTLLSRCADCHSLHRKIWGPGGP